MAYARLRGVGLQKIPHGKESKLLLLEVPRQLARQETSSKKVRSTMRKILQRNRAKHNTPLCGSNVPELAINEALNQVELSTLKERVAKLVHDFSLTSHNTSSMHPLIQKASLLLSSSNATTHKAQLAELVDALQSACATAKKVPLSHFEAVHQVRRCYLQARYGRAGLRPKSKHSKRHLYHSTLDASELTRLVTAAPELKTLPEMLICKQQLYSSRHNTSSRATIMKAHDNVQKGAFPRSIKGHTSLSMSFNTHKGLSVRDSSLEEQSGQVDGCFVDYGTLLTMPHRKQLPQRVNIKLPSMTPYAVAKDSLLNTIFGRFRNPPAPDLGKR